MDRAIAEEAVQESTTETKGHPHFSQVDLNGDSALSLSEILALRSVQVFARFRERFNNADNNSDHLVDFEELSAAQTQNLRGYVFDKLDAGNDGQLTLNESAKTNRKKQNYQR